MRRLLILSLAIAATSVVSGCSDEPGKPSAADTTFVQDMAISASVTMDMADQARARSTDPQVAALATRVADAAAPIIDELAALGPQLAEDGADGFAHEDSQAHEDDSTNRPAQLDATSSKAFDDAFLNLVAEELQGGQAIARNAQQAATDPRTQALATSIEATWADLIKQVPTK